MSVRTLIEVVLPIDIFQHKQNRNNYTNPGFIIVFSMTKPNRFGFQTVFSFGIEILLEITYHDETYTIDKNRKHRLPFIHENARSNIQL